jgi:hypothetical protein
MNMRATGILILNDRGERIEKCVDDQGIWLNLEYWDCECDNNFIHPISQEVCNMCATNRENQPNSREDEVKHFLAKGKL